MKTLKLKEKGDRVRYLFIFHTRNIKNIIYTTDNYNVSVSKIIYVIF